jgi:putative hemolysin
MDTALLVLLILLNGAFAMSEMALTAARKTRLQVLVDDGLSGAQRALDLHENPTKFLSVVQIGITSIGILNGIVGEAAFAEPLAGWLRATFDMDPQWASVVSTGLVVIVITFLTIIFGELVPKRIGQLYPETVARLVAPTMEWLSIVARPFVKLLAFCTEGTLRLLGIRPGATRGVTEEEIAAQLEEGLDAGVIEAQEHQMVRNVFRLDERQIGSMMIPRADVRWLDAQATDEQVLSVLAEADHTRYPVCKGSLDDVVGVITAAALLRQITRGGKLDLLKGLAMPVFVPETLSGMELLEHFRETGAELVFVVDEYGEIQGVITVRDLLEAITGEFTTPSDADAWAVQRDDGSWLIDGLIPVPELKDRLGLKALPEEERGRYNTMAGMVMLLLGRLPEVTDTVEWDGWRFEVVDLDGKRVDKVLASRLPEDGPESSAA